MAPPPCQVSDRRLFRRYAVDVPLEFRAVLGSGTTISGAGRTVNLSDSGVFFESAGSLPPGLQIQMCIEWPARGGSALSVKLYGTGVTVHGRGSATAVVFQQYEFRAAAPATAEQAIANSPDPARHW